MHFLLNLFGSVLNVVQLIPMTHSLRFFIMIELGVVIRPKFFGGLPRTHEVMHYLPLRTTVSLMGSNVRFSMASEFTELC